MKTAQDKLYQILDANLNRCGEGLRVIEEIARFVLIDSDLQRRTKRLRQQLGRFFDEKTSLPVARLKLIGGGRDSQTDIGRRYSTAGEMNRRSFEAVLRSNFSRVEESARALEEFSKMIDQRIAEKIKQFRFKIYSLERTFVEKHFSRAKECFLRRMGIYPIIDREKIDGRDPLVTAKEIIEGGAASLQYRDKISDEDTIYSVCKRLSDLCKRKDVRFIVNGAVDIALAANTDGVHLEQGDLPVAEARKILGHDKISGKSAHSITEARRAAKEDIDYLAVGAIFPSVYKLDYRLAGLKLLKWAKDNISLPVTAIGGINLKNIDQVLAFQPNGVAISSGIFEAKDIRKQTGRFARKCRASQKSKK